MEGGGESCECVIAVVEALMVVNRALSALERRGRGPGKSH